MDFWEVFREKARLEDFGKERLLMRTAERHNSSLDWVEDRSIELEEGRAFSAGYTEEKRYVIAKNLSFGLVVTVYDVNSGSIIALRSPSALGTEAAEEIKRRVKRLENPNIEVRAIGLQDGDIEMAESLASLRGAVNGGRLVELDLFGNETRNIAIDIKTGSSFNLLLLNRIYKPGELVNSGKKAPAAGKSELRFV